MIRTRTRQYPLQRRPMPFSYGSPSPPNLPSPRAHARLQTLTLDSTVRLERVPCGAGTVGAMTDDTLKDRLAKQGEETLGKLAQDLLENPFVTGALTRAFEARERAVQVQEAAMGALNMPSAADVERLTRRLRAVAQRLEGIEDVLDRLERKPGGDDRLAAIEKQLTDLTAEVRKLGAKPAPARKSAAKKASTS